MLIALLFQLTSCRQAAKPRAESELEALPSAGGVMLVQYANEDSIDICVIADPGFERTVPAMQQNIESAGEEWLSILREVGARAHIGFDCRAQRALIRVGNYPRAQVNHAANTGFFGPQQPYWITVHEMGHFFGFADGYREGGGPLPGEVDSIMSGGRHDITQSDKEFLQAMYLRYFRDRSPTEPRRRESPRRVVEEDDPTPEPIEDAGDAPPLEPGRYTDGDGRARTVQNVVGTLGRWQFTVASRGNFTCAGLRCTSPDVGGWIEVKSDGSGFWEVRPGGTRRIEFYAE
jgi:hypothetical protein